MLFLGSAHMVIIANLSMCFFRICSNGDLCKSIHMFLFLGSAQMVIIENADQILPFCVLHLNRQQSQMLFRYDDFSKCQKNETIVPRKLFKILFQLFNIFQATCFFYIIFSTILQVWAPISKKTLKLSKVPFVNLHYSFNSVHFISPTGER